MSAKPAKQPHTYRVGDKAYMRGYLGTIISVAPMRVQFKPDGPDGGGRRWFKRKGDRWVAERRDDLILWPA